jgi:hypothetical protein
VDLSLLQCQGDVPPVEDLARKLKTVEIILDSPRNALAGAWGIGALKEVRGMERVTISSCYPWHTEKDMLQQVRQAMLRPRLEHIVARTDKGIDPFQRRREVFRASDEKLLDARCPWTWNSRLELMSRTLAANGPVGQNRYAELA